MDGPIGEVDNLLAVVLLTTIFSLDHQPPVNWLAVGVGDLLAAVRVEPLNLTTVCLRIKKRVSD